MKAGLKFWQKKKIMSNSDFNVLNLGIVIGDTF